MFPNPRHSSELTIFAGWARRWQRFSSEMTLLSRFSYTSMSSLRLRTSSERLSQASLRRRMGLCVSPIRARLSSHDIWGGSTTENFLWTLAGLTISTYTSSYKITNSATRSSTVSLRSRKTRESIHQVWPAVVTSNSHLPHHSSSYWSTSGSITASTPVGGSREIPPVQIALMVQLNSGSLLLMV